MEFRKGVPQDRYLDGRDGFEISAELKVIGEEAPETSKRGAPRATEGELPGPGLRDLRGNHRLSDFPIRTS